MRLTPGMHRALRVMDHGDRTTCMVRVSHHTTDLGAYVEHGHRYPLAVYHGTARRLVLDGYVVDEGDRLTLTDKGRVYIATHLSGVEDRGAA